MSRHRERAAGRTRPLRADGARRAVSLLDWVPSDVERGYWRLSGDTSPSADTCLPESMVVDIVEARAAAGRAAFDRLPSPFLGERDPRLAGYVENGPGP